MANIYSGIEGIDLPEFDWKNIKAYKEAEQKYIADLKANVTDGKEMENIGEVIRFPVADGSAQYMVASLRPVELIHIGTWDAYQFEYAHRLTKKDVLEKIQQQKNLEKLFGGKK